MYYKIDDFLNDWEYEREATLKIFDALTDASLTQKVISRGRSLGFLAWHITISIGEMMNRTGLKIMGPAEESDAPSSVLEIRTAYNTSSASLVDEINNQWNDESLNIEDDMYGSMWKRGFTLGSLITHQVHHRGQMTVLMRQAGLKVPGIYGPSYEEWAAMGMEPPK